jgi:hypothetical protein
MGLNFTPIVHLPLAGNIVVQVVAPTAKSPAVETLMPFSATAWLFCKVNVLDGLKVHTLCAAYVAFVGVKAVGKTPVPVSITFCGLSPALSLKVKVPVIFPST